MSERGNQSGREDPLFGQLSVASRKPVLRRAELADLPPYRKPGGPVQLRLASIWADVLGLDRVGIDDDFFALGGDSMTATLMFAEIERVVGRKVPTALLVRAPTIATLALQLRGESRRYESQMLVPMRATGTRPPLVMLHGHNGRVLFVQRLSWMLPAEQPVYAVQARGFDQSPPHASVAAMVRDYADEILRTFRGREIYLAGYCYGGILAIEVQRLLAEAGLPVRRLIAVDPPVFPRRVAKPLSASEMAALARKHSEGLARRIGKLAASNPERAEWYAPGGPGYAAAMQVAESLAHAYSGFVPQPTTVPMDLIWSAQFYQALKRKRPRWALARGPVHTSQIVAPNTEVTHQTLLRQHLPGLAQRLERLIVDDLALSSPLRGEVAPHGRDDGVSAIVAEPERAGEGDAAE